MLVNTALNYKNLQQSIKNFIDSSKKKVIRDAILLNTDQSTLLKPLYLEVFTTSVPRDKNSTRFFIRILGQTCAGITSLFMKLVIHIGMLKSVLDLIQEV